MKPRNYTFISELILTENSSQISFKERFVSHLNTYERSISASKFINYGKMLLVEAFAVVASIKGLEQSGVPAIASAIAYPALETSIEIAKYVASQAQAKMEALINAGEYKGGFFSKPINSGKISEAEFEEIPEDIRSLPFFRTIADNKQPLRLAPFPQDVAVPMAISPKS